MKNSQNSYHPEPKFSDCLIEVLHEIHDESAKFGKIYIKNRKFMILLQQTKITTNLIKSQNLKSMCEILGDKKGRRSTFEKEKEKRLRTSRIQINPKDI